MSDNLSARENLKSWDSGRRAHGKLGGHLSKLGGMSQDVRVSLRMRRWLLTTLPLAHRHLPQSLVFFAGHEGTGGLHNARSIIMSQLNDDLSRLKKRASAARLPVSPAILALEGKTERQAGASRSLYCRGRSEAEPPGSAQNPSHRQAPWQPQYPTSSKCK